MVAIQQLYEDRTRLASSTKNVSRMFLLLSHFQNATTGIGILYFASQTGNRDVEISPEKTADLEAGDRETPPKDCI